jgi:hypothetical protein
MSAWKGSEFNYHAAGCPHKTKIPRKPEGVGSELKALADSETGVLLRLDVMEGKVANGTKKYSKLGEGTAVTLRLTEPYWATGRTVVTDSAFGSVKCAAQLAARGTFIMAMVKTAHKEFPLEYLKRWTAGALPSQLEPPSRGDHVLLMSKQDGDALPLFALCWADRKVKTIISTRGTTSPGNASQRPRHRKIVENGKYVTVQYSKAVKRPVMVEQFFNSFAAVDIHDHLRQGSLGMEREWLTHTWWHRLYATIFSVSVVDAYLGYKFEMVEGGKVPDDFTTFLGALAFQLANNTISETRMALRMDVEEEIILDEVSFDFLILEYSY